MNLWINYALISFCVKVYSRFNFSLSHLNFSRNNQFRTLNYVNLLNKLKMTNSSKFKFFTPNSLSHNSSLNKAVGEVLIVPVLQDNYSYILKDPASSNALCVDPVEYEKVYNVSKENNLTLKLALCTHKHWDHSGGNNGIKKLVPDIQVVGSSYEDTPGVTLPVKHQQTIPFGSLVIECLKASCHTMGHIMYYIYHPTNPNLQPLLFSGDTLFVCGCGRFFEGNAKSMLEIVKSVKSLPEHTLLYCGHEYTLKNLQFAYTVDPSDVVLKKLDWAKETISKGLPTVPSTLQEEKLYNPFLRVEELMKSLNENSEESAMNKLRSLKDKF